jgi:hypothetical protein
MGPPESDVVTSRKARPEPRVGEEELYRLSTESNERRKRDIVLRRAEIILWLLAGVGFYIFRYQFVMSQPQASVSHTFFDLFVAALIILIPIVFQLVFQLLPLEAVRLQYARRGSPFEQAKAKHVRAARHQVGSPLEMTAVGHNSISLLQDMAERSDNIAEKIYTRAGVYLLFGVMIAFSGLGFFYLETRDSNAPASVTGIEAKGKEETRPAVSHYAQRTPMEALASMMPPLLGRIGVLFFIELVAFFFLRQYRAAMDEYRYFEAIKRRREENLATATMLFQSAGDKIDFFAFIAKCSLYSDLPKLVSGETTEILETRKLTKDEAALFEKMIDAIAKVKN